MGVGCCSTVPPKAPIPSNLTESCKRPVTLNQGADMGALLEASVANNYALVECSARHAALVELVK